MRATRLAESRLPGAGTELQAANTALPVPRGSAATNGPSENVGAGFWNRSLTQGGKKKHPKPKAGKKNKTSQTEVCGAFYLKVLPLGGVRLPKTIKRYCSTRKLHSNNINKAKRKTRGEKRKKEERTLRRGRMQRGAARDIVAARSPSAAGAARPKRGAERGGGCSQPALQAAAAGPGW